MYSFSGASNMEVLRSRSVKSHSSLVLLKFTVYAFDKNHEAHKRKNHGTKSHSFGVWCETNPLLKSITFFYDTSKSFSGWKYKKKGSEINKKNFLRSFLKSWVEWIWIHRRDGHYFRQFVRNFWQLFLILRYFLKTPVIYRKTNLSQLSEIMIFMSWFFLRKTRFI